MSDNQSLDNIQEEVARNKFIAKSTLNGYNGRNLIYINGSIYNDSAMFSTYKGCGWFDGMIECVKLNNVPSDAQVFVVSLSFGRLRRLEYREKTPYPGYNWFLVKELDDQPKEDINCNKNTSNQISLTKKVADHFINGIPYVNKERNIRIEQTISYFTLYLNDKPIAKRDTMNKNNFSISTHKIFEAIGYLAALPGVKIIIDYDGSIYLNGELWNWDKRYTLICNKDDAQDK